jgi:hypothetical protein
MHPANLLRELLASRFNMDPADLLIGPLGQAEGTGPDPMAWLVSGLSAAQATALLDIQALVSDALTAYFFLYAPHLRLCRHFLRLHDPCRQMTLLSPSLLMLRWRTLPLPASSMRTAMLFPQT